MYNLYNVHQKYLVYVYENKTLVHLFAFIPISKPYTHINLTVYEHHIFAVYFDTFLKRVLSFLAF